MQIDQVKGLLPKQVVEIAEAIGLPATQRLVEALGGTTWTVAKGVRRLGIIRHEALKDVIGEQAASIMAERWANVPLYIPKCDAAIRRLRDLEINRQFEQGVREQTVTGRSNSSPVRPSYSCACVREGVSANTLVAELARSNNLSDRRVWEILKQPSPEAMGDLFH